jgi:hypothetical protein
MSPRKSLFFGSAALFLAVLFAFTGCDNPAGPKGEPGQDVTGDQGDTGAYGGFRLSESVKDVDLKEAFEQDTLVILLANVETVYGTVPPGGTLRVLGDTRVEARKELKLEGNAKLEIIKSGVLRADGTTWQTSPPTTSGLLVSLNGTPQVTGAGRIYLPAVQTLDTPTDFLHWESNAVVNVSHQYPGSFYDGQDITAFNSDSIALLFERRDDLSIPSVTDLTVNVIPSGKKLTLLESNSTLAGSLSLNSGATLVVAGTGPGNVAGLTIGGEFTGGSGSKFIISEKGTVDLGTSGYITPGSPINLTVTNDGTIITGMNPSPPYNNLSILLGLDGTGTIELTTNTTFTYTSLPAIVLKQNLFINPGTAGTFILPNLPVAPFAAESSPGKTITIGPNGILELGPAITHIGYTDITTPANPIDVNFKVVIKTTGDIDGTGDGKITTATTSSLTLTNIFDNLQFNDSTPKTKGLVVSSAAVGLGAPLEIPESTVLQLAASTPYFALAGTAGPRDLAIRGTLEVNNAVSLAPPGNVTISGIVDIKNSGGSFVFGPGTNDISSSAVFKGPGFLKGNPASTIKIGPTEGYVFESSTGVAANNYAEALEAIEAAKLVLTDTVPLANSEFPDYTEKVVGTVDLSRIAANNLVSIVKLDSAIAAGDPVILPTNPGLTTLSITTRVSMGPEFDVSDAFAFGVGSTAPYIGHLRLSDANTASVSVTTSDKFGVLEVQKYKIVNSNITSPELTDTFHIGVKSRRAN